MLYGNQMTRRCTCPGNLSASLETSRKRSKAVKSSCKNCGGKFVVDGIEPMSKSALGIVGREVTNSVVPEINWKTVTKGKRSRKAVARCMNRSSELGNKSPKRVGDFSGSDSDKLGEMANGQGFSVAVPLKKRRHFYRSPSPSSRPSYGSESISPSQIPSSHPDGLEHLSDHSSYTNRLRQAGKDLDTGAMDAASKLANGVFCSPDFHGISLLAAAACINNPEDVAFNVKAEAVEVSSTPQRSDGSTSTLPQMLKACSESGKQLHKQDESVEAAKPVSSKVDRLHWDLNAPMEAWEQPIDDDIADSSMILSTEGIQTFHQDGLAFDNVSDKENDVVLDQFEVAKELKLEENSSEGCCPQRSSVEENSTLNLSSGKHASLVPVDAKLSTPLLIKNEFCNNSPEAESCQSSEVSGVCLDNKSLTISQDKISCRNADSVPEKYDAQTNLAEDSEKITDFSVDKTSLGQNLSLVSSDILGAEGSGIISANSTQPLSKNSSAAASDISIAGDNSFDVKGREEKLLAVGILENEAGVDSDSKEILPKLEDHHITYRESEENLEDCQNLGVSQEGIVELSRKAAVPEAGYDSPYEDGELRGSILYSWEENQYMDGEQECVDYESDCRGGDEFEAGDLHDPNVEADSEGTVKGSYLAAHVAADALRSSSGRSPRRRDFDKHNFEKTDASAEKLSNQGSGTTEEMTGDVTVGRNYGRMRRHHGDHFDADEEKGSGREEVRSNRRKFQSRFEGASSFDTMEEDFVPNRRFRDNGLYFRDERDAVPGRFYKGYRPEFHSRERNGGEGECDYWESRNRYPSGYRSFEGRGPTRPRMTGHDTRGKFEQKQLPLNYSSRAERDGSPDRLVSRFGERDRTFWEPAPRLRYPPMRYPPGYDGPQEENGQTRSRNPDKFGGFNKSIDYPSKNMHRPVGWNRSLNDREFRGGPRRFPGFNNGGRGGGPRRFSEGFSRGGGRGGFREEYHPSHDEDPSPWRGERRYFAHSRRGGHVAGPNRRGSRSRSRSRTRSPRPWGPPAQRDRRRLSRSPDFRRAPFQKPSFAPDYDDGYMSPPPPRGRFSSPPRGRFSSPPRGGFRQRKPSFNGFRQGQRLDSGEGFNSEEADLRNQRAPFNVFRQGGLPEEEGLKLKSEEESLIPDVECKMENANIDKEQDSRSEAVL